MHWGWVVVVVIAVLAILYVLYSRLIRLRNRALEALSSVDVQLKKRHNLIPNLVKMAQKYMDYEKSLLEDVVRLREQAQAPYERTDATAVDEHFQAEAALQAGLGRFRVAMENYPDLKAQGPLIEAQDALQEVEGQISAARRFYNSAVTNLNSAVQIFPGPMIAAIAKVDGMPWFELDDAEARKPIDVDQLMR